MTLNLDTTMNWVLARLAERSTWVGLTGLLTAVGISISPDSTKEIIDLGLSVAGLVLMMTKDHHPATPSA